MTSPLSAVVWFALAVAIAVAAVRNRRAGASLGVLALHAALFLGCLAGVLGAVLGAPKT